MSLRNNSEMSFSFIWNLIFLSIIYVLTAGSFPADSPRKSLSYPEAKTKTKSVPSKKAKSKSESKTVSPKAVKSECCPIGRRFQSMVELEEICFNEHSTEFRFRLLLAGAICSISDSIALTDNIGNSYKVLRMDGITECPSMTQNSVKNEFTWTFEKVQVSAENLNLTEDRNAVPYSTGWVWWYWDDIDIRQCRRK